MCKDEVFANQKARHIKYAVFIGRPEHIALAGDKTAGALGN